ncbi:antiterminator Q family protein [Pragia fontium]|uniref:Antitermination protein n=2 Tax=Pragia fontium TaxID=82985 RepID=A0AAJ4WAM9_9GAMM|nr:antiterminator Q family protein [Pragia fontium]AKJ42834.1 hypothetical protein QQ39_12715 [Pragia fontium]SFC86040.1 hypothetical protein SAMN02745723_10513 [Pragia fontium DSM 5563 = ATCC 49100]SUB83222.1 Phage antitermination protein Q [Pragia fontium]VEJ56117.1 Phage antitermination protein Q [Pragia fontium]GKX62280.1 hypothetical protein SOASR032_08490 [Pragia fontium]
MRDIKTVLKGWANVRGTKRVGTEFPSHSSGFISVNQQFDYRPFLTEDEAELVDKSVLRLRSSDPFAYAVLTSYYLNRISCNRQAKVMGKRPHSISETLNYAEKYVLAKIDDAMDVAA